MIKNILRLNARGGEPIVLDDDLNVLLTALMEKEVYADNIVEHTNYILYGRQRRWHLHKVNKKDK